jgi:hypothetical protein
MRLDEWQKFIESQFLEETPPPPQAVKPIVVAPPGEQQTILLLEDEPISLPDDVQEEAVPVAPSVPSVVSGSVTDLEIEVASAPLPPPPIQKTPRQSGFIVRSDVEPPVQTPVPLPAVSPVPFEPTLDIDADIPVFADYLPLKSLETEVLQQHPPVVAQLLEDDTWGPVSVLLPLRSAFATATAPPAAPNLHPVSESEPNAGERRRKRAPQVRNVQPENVGSGLESADLWAQVPRHVQTLLALERREEEREVAQSSYKRPFQEKRAELIARILDPVLSLEDTARLLNVCPTTVRRYTNKGILTHYRKEPERPSANTSERETRQRRFRLSDILAFLETQQAALEADRLQERVAPSRRKRPTAPLEAAHQE